MMNVLLRVRTYVRTNNQRGFTLLITMILTAVILGVGLSLLDISLKQVTLASSARQSVYAFYNADSALECGLYWDSLDTFDYTSEPPSGGTITCQGQSINYSLTNTGSTTARTTQFTIACPSGGSTGDVTIVKQNTGSTHFYANGYNTCDAGNPQRVERGEEAHY